MPIPLSGQQRHVLSALGYVSDGRDNTYIAAKLSKIYSYLTQDEIEEVISEARKAKASMRSIAEAGPDATVSDYAVSDNGLPYNVVSVVANWTDKKGRKQYRTVRCMVPKGASKKEADVIIRDEIKAMLSGKGMYGR